MIDDVVIRNARQEDLPAIARCHSSAFPESLSSAMGQAYLVKMLSWYLSDSKTFLFFLEQDRQCIGYCGGMVVDGQARSGSASGMTQHSFSSAVRAILLRPWLFFHPEFLSKYKFILKNIRFKINLLFSRTPVKPVTQSNLPHVGLVVIGVNKRHHGKGYGSQLLKHFEQISQSKGFNKLMLTVLSDNSRAIKSYERNGWRISQINAKSTTMEKILN